MSTILEAGKSKTEMLLIDFTKNMKLARLTAGYGRQEQGQTAKELHIQGTGQTTVNQLVLIGFRLNWCMGQYQNPCTSATGATRRCV
jgi:hypothetical protein